MKQAAFNRGFRLAENFSVTHIINHSSHIKYSLCLIHIVCESVCWLAAVALEEIPFFRSAKEGSVVPKIPSGVQLSFPSCLCLLMGNLLHTDFLGCKMATNATTGLLLHSIPVPLRQQGKRWHPQPVVGSKQEESHAQEKHSHMLGSDVHPLHGGFSRDWQSHPTSDVTYRTTSGRPVDAVSLYSLSSDTSVVPPLMCDLPKFGHVSTDAVYSADSDCTCSYCNHMFK